MQIGELVKSTGKSVAALRYYEQVGLLAPLQRTETGYREYSMGAMERILTFSAKHFRRFEAGENIVVVEPASIQ